MTSLTLSNIANEIFDLRVRETCMDVMNTIIKRVELSEHRRTKDTLAFLRREVNFFFFLQVHKKHSTTYTATKKPSCDETTRYSAVYNTNGSGRECVEDQIRVDGRVSTRSERFEKTSRIEL